MKNLILTGAISLIVGFVFGILLKHCPTCIECQECPKVNTEYLEIVKKVIKEEREDIKNETNEKINYIDTVRVNKLDSIWTDYFEKYGHNFHRENR